MKRRKYSMEKRAQLSEETRTAIIEAARELLSQTGYPDMSLQELAQRAGVARQTIYAQFGSKRGVLQAVALYIERESYGRPLLEGTLEVADPIHTIRDGINDQFRFFERNTDLLRTFYAQAASDPDFGAVWHDRMAELLVSIRLLVERIQAEGKLADGWSVDEASDWLWSLVNFQLYDEMVTQRGWTGEQLARRARQSIDSMLLKPGLTSDGEAGSHDGR